MTKEQLIAMGLTEEQADKVLNASKEEMANYIPKSRFDEVNNSNKDLKTQIADRDKQLEALSKNTGDNEALKGQIKQLQDANEKATADYEAKLKQTKIDSAIELALANAKAKSVKAAKALLDASKIELDGDNVKGLDEQIKALTESEESKFLFGSGKVELDGMKPGEGGNPDGGTGEPKSLADAVRMHFTSND